MSAGTTFRPLVGLLLILLHLPFVHVTIQLIDRLAAGQGLMQLPGIDLMTWAAMLLLPHLALSLLGLHWNPARARLGEPDDL